MRRERSTRPPHCGFNFVNDRLQERVRTYDTVRFCQVSIVVLLMHLIAQLPHAILMAQIFRFQPNIINQLLHAETVCIAILCECSMFIQTNKKRKKE